ncbi:MAG TPA: hypothetical protein HPP83_04695 [Candidatus Hydrogenedentes bacterium]|nr:hypothetical protein [Candidatus Hydrogenedentota bacterium]
MKRIEPISKPGRPGRLFLKEATSCEWPPWVIALSEFIVRYFPDLATEDIEYKAYIC